MKFWKLVSSIIALVLSTNIHAALIDNGNYTTDDVNNLDWLDLTYTDGIAYTPALSAASEVEGGGWSYATEQQITSLWNQAFGTDWTLNSAGYLSSTEYTVEVDRFYSLFGETVSTATVYYSAGLFEDDNGNLRLIAAGRVINTGLNKMYGPNYTGIYDAYREAPNTSLGTFLVRTTVVPVPAAVWLFGSGLIGLAGFARRKA